MRYNITMAARNWARCAHNTSTASRKTAGMNGTGVVAAWLLAVHVHNVHKVLVGQTPQAARRAVVGLGRGCRQACTVRAGNKEYEIKEKKYCSGQGELKIVADFSRVVRAAGGEGGMEVEANKAASHEHRLSCQAPGTGSCTARSAGCRAAGLRTEG